MLITHHGETGDGSKRRFLSLTYHRGKKHLGLRGLIKERPYDELIDFKVFLLCALIVFFLDISLPGSSTRCQSFPQLSSASAELVLSGERMVKLLLRLFSVD